MSWLRWVSPRPKGLGLRGFDRYAPQKRGARDWDISKLQLKSSARLGADLTRFTTVLDQRSSSSCVAHAWEEALLIEARRLGFNGGLAELGSRLAGYFNARAEHGDQFTDQGTYLRCYASALKRCGRCPESAWPFKFSRINRRPSARAYQRAYAMRGLRGYYRIYDSGDARLGAICAALDNGHPVVFGMRIDEAFRSGSGSVISIPKRPYIGGHAMCVVGYKWVGGKLMFKVINSWGKHWRDGGFCWFPAELMAWRLLEDVWVASLV